MRYQSDEKAGEESRGEKLMEVNVVYQWVGSQCRG